MDLLLDWRSLGSLVATFMVFRTALRDFLPPEVQRLLQKLLVRITAALRPATCTVIIDESDDASGGTNDLYDSAQLYLGSHCLAAAPTVRVHKTRQARRPVASLPDSHTALDTFSGVKLKWKSRSVERAGGNSGHGMFNPYGRAGGLGEQRSLKLQFPRVHRDMIHNEYIPYVLDEANKLRQKARQRKLYTNRLASPRDDLHRMWSSHSFSHPSTFDTIAIDPKLRDEIRADLLRFVQRREHYARVGRAWKRGYLLYGPPGTGKTSLVAAIANLLKFDVYDLELTTVPTNSHLRRLLGSTTPKSLVVIEDIDCSLDLSDRKKEAAAKAVDEDSDKAQPYMMSPAATAREAIGREAISLSGVLNFVDGLWSSCVGERLMVFTTNHPDRLDPALLRPGRMDRKVELGYCAAPALRIIARNYLGIGDGDEMDGVARDLMAEAEGLLAKVNVTPADVAEVFMGCDGDGAQAALQKLVDELKWRKQAATATATPTPAVDTNC